MILCISVPLTQGRSPRPLGDFSLITGDKQIVDDNLSQAKEDGLPLDLVKNLMKVAHEEVQYF